MHFLNPWGFLFALFIPGIIILYLLKQKRQRIDVSSVQLWSQAIDDMTATRPWQKFKNNILMYLEIGIIICLTLALTRPFIANSDSYGHYIVVLDSSASMQADDVKPTRFEKAKDDIQSIIDTLLPSQYMTIIEMGPSSYIAADRISDKGLLSRILKDMMPTNGEGDIKGAMDLAESMLSSEDQDIVCIFTDQNINIEDSLFKVKLYNGDGQNRAITHMSYSEYGDGWGVLAKIMNFGDSSNITLKCSADDQLVDIKEISLPKGDKKDVYFTSIPRDTNIVKVEIVDKDNLLIDNVSWIPIKERAENKGLLVTQGNIFLEKVLNFYGGLLMEKGAYEASEGLLGYQLYVYDGYVPKDVPEDGNIIIFNPQGDQNLFKVVDNFMPKGMIKNISSRYNRLLEHVDIDDINIRKASKIGFPNWGEEVVGDGDNTLIWAGEMKSQKFIVFAFDIHESDLPLKMDFPILMGNILNWILPGVKTNTLNCYAGEEVAIDAIPGSSSIDIVLPDGSEKRVAPPYPIVPFDDTTQLGVYTIKQGMGSGTIEDRFTVSVPTHGESDLALKNRSYDIQNTQKERTVEGRRELWPYFALVALAFMLIEWWVYRRGY